MHQFKSVPNLNSLMEINPDLEFVLWDMDGTIMETECLHSKGTAAILNHYHASSEVPSMEEIDKLCIGATDGICLQKLKSLNLLLEMSEEEFISQKTIFISKELESKDIIDLINSGVINLLKECNRNGIKQAVVTSSEKELTHILLKFLNLNHFFEFILTREDTKKNKPDPLPYLTALEKFKAAKEKCLIIEDSQTGLAAANASNIMTIQARWYY